MRGRPRHKAWLRDLVVKRASYSKHPLGTSRAVFFCYNKLMLLFALFSWWYTAGWLQLAHLLTRRMAGVLDFFSVGLLLKSLFAPFRQISVGKVQGPIGVQLRAWADLQISRVIGAIVRLMVIAFGLVTALAMLIVVVSLLVIWPLLPAMPLLALLFTFGSSG